MKQRFISLCLLLLCALTRVAAQALIEDGVYAISCQQTAGYVALGAQHGIDPYICFVTDGGAVAADGYWVVTNTRSGYTFRNEASGEYLAFTTDRVDQYYKGMILAATAPTDKSHYWLVSANDDGSLSVRSAIDESYYWNLRANQRLLGTYAGGSRSQNERFYFTPKDGGAVTPTPSAMTRFPEALHVYLNDGCIEAYPLEYVAAHNETGGQLVIRTNDGQTHTYPLSSVSRISEEAPTDFPTFESFKFNNKFNDQLFTDAMGEMRGDTVFVTLAAIGKRLTPSFKVPDDQTLVYVDGQRQDSKVSRLRFDRDIYYVVTRPGCTMLLPDLLPDGTRSETSLSMQPYGRMGRVHVDWLTDRAEVPRIYINTSDGEGIYSKEEFKDATISIDGYDVFPSMDPMPVQIKGRGNSSWGWPKKPYRLKFAEKVKPLGMKAGKSWVLLSNYNSGSMMSNAIGMKAANLIGATAANHIVPVELYLNGEYRGSYNLTEKVGFANNSVDLADESAAALLELDSYYDEPEGQKFRSMPYNLPINVKEPDFSEGTSRLTLETVQQDFNAFLATLFRGQDITQHVDLDQLVRYLMVNELICNFEFYHPKSTFCYRESFESDTSKYVFGPVWDLDWAFGYEQNRNYFRGNATSNYWTEMPNFEVKPFVQALRFNYEPLGERYRQLFEAFMADGLEELKEYGQDYYDFARNSFANNRNVWGDNTDYAQQARQAAEWLETRANKIYEDIVNDVRPEPVKPVEPVEFANNKLYTITCRRGALVLNEEHTGLDAGQTRWWAPDEDRQFAIIGVGGNNYLYSPVTKMFLHYSDNGTWVPQLGSPIYFDDTHADGEYLYMMSTLTDGGSYLYFNNNSSLVINSWNTPDDGDRWKIEPVADFDPSEALEMAAGGLFDVTMNVVYGGQVIASEAKQLPFGAALPTPSAEWANAFVKLEPRGMQPMYVDGDIELEYEAVWNGPFGLTEAEDNAQWYNMTIRTEYYVSTQDTEPYYPVAVDDATTLAKPEYQWAFGGNPYKIRLYNRATGFDKVLTPDGGNAVMRPGGYEWELIPNGDGFVLRQPATATVCINQFGGHSGPLQFWDSARSLTDDGSTFRVTVAPELYDGIADLAENDVAGKSLDGRWYTLDGRRLTERPSRPGIYIVGGRKVVVK